MNTTRLTRRLARPRMLTMKTKPSSPKDRARTIYFPSFLVEKLGFAELQDRGLSASRRVAEAAARYVWLAERLMPQTLELFTEDEQTYLLRITNFQGWVEVESPSRNLLASFDTLSTKNPDHHLNIPDLRDKLARLSPAHTVALCEWIDRVNLIGQDRSPPRRTEHG